MRKLTEAKMVPCGRVVDTTLPGSVFSAVGFPRRARYAIVATIGLTLQSGQLPPHLHVTLAQFLCHQSLVALCTAWTEAAKKNTENN